MDNNFTQFMSTASMEGGIMSELFSETMRTEIVSDNIIPDTISDADKILLCTATPKVEGRYISGNTVDIEGSVTYDVLLATENNTLSGLSFTEPFTATASHDGIDDDCQFLVLPKVDYVVGRLINPRKLNLRSQTSMNLRVFSSVPTTPTVTGSESLDDDMNLQRNFIEFQSAVMQTAEEREIPVSYDIELDSSAPPAAEIVHTSLRLHPLEVRTRGEEADVKTHAAVSIIYRTEEGNFFTTDKTFTLEKTLALPVSDAYEWIVTATPGTLNAEIASNSYGEMKIIELDFTYDLLLTALHNQAVSATSDMYSTEFECDPSFREVSTTALRRVYGTSLSVNASAPRADIHAENVRSVFCGSVFLKEVTAAYNKDKGKLCVEGTGEISLVGENNRLSEEDELFYGGSFSYPFRCELDAGEDLTDATLLLDYGITDTRFRADSGHLYGDFELTLRVVALGKHDERFLTSLHLDRSTPVSRSAAPITLCYPSGRESLWDIAKYYKITEDSIVMSNGLTSDDIRGKKVLLIPRAEPKRALFSKVI